MDTVEEWQDWSNELAMLLPDEAEGWPGVNPEGAQESIVTAALVHLLAVRDAVEAQADQWEKDGEQADSDMLGYAGRRLRAILRGDA